MENMTWKEFKNLVDAELKRKGISENEIIDYIDISNPYKSHTMCKPEVYFDTFGIAIH